MTAILLLASLICTCLGRRVQTLPETFNVRERSAPEPGPPAASRALSGLLRTFSTGAAWRFHGTSCNLAAKPSSQRNQCVVLQPAAKGRRSFRSAEHEVKMQAPQTASDRVILAGFSFASGWVNVATFLRYKCYATMMTGNIVNFAAALTNCQWMNVLFIAGMLSHYVGGSAIYRSLAMGRKSPLSASAVATVAVFILVLHDLLAIFSPYARWHAFILALAFGIITGISTGTLKTITNLMTGHLQKLGFSFGEVASGTALTPAQKGTAVTSTLIILAFIAGVSAATAITTRFNLAPVFSIVGVFFVLLCGKYDRLRLADRVAAV